MRDNNGKFTKGNPGKKPGTKNKPKPGKKFLHDYLVGLITDETFKGWLESPDLAIKDKINAYLKALEFVMPKQQKIELDGDIHTNLIQVKFESTNVLPIHSETDFLDD